MISLSYVLINIYTLRYLVDETCFNVLLLGDKHEVLPPTPCREPINIHIDLVTFKFNLLTAIQ